MSLRKEKSAMEMHAMLANGVKFYFFNNIYVRLLMRVNHFTSAE